MKYILEWIFGLDRGFLNQQGEASIQFHPRWPGQDALNYLFTKMGFGPIGAAFWNVLLGSVALMLVIYVYRRESRSRGARITLAAIRCLILAFVIALLNMPVFTIGQSRTEPSVLALLVDDTISMRVKDVTPAGAAEPISRMDSIIHLLNDRDQALVKDLAKTHILRFYRFNRQAIPLLSLAETKKPDKKEAADEKEKKDDKEKSADYAAVLKAISDLKPDGQSTQVLSSVRNAIEDLQGQRLAGVVVITDGRSTPREAAPEGIALLKNYGIKVFPVAVGSEKAPKDLILESVNVQDSAFEGDIVNIRAQVRGIGFAPGFRAKVSAISSITKAPLRRSDGRPVEKDVVIENDKPVDVELQWKAERAEDVKFDVIVQKEPGELDDENNIRSAQVSVLDARINVLYVDGYPRWEYRYIKNEMIRDPSIRISCLLTEADPGFAQEGSPATADFPGPIKRFPESIAEMLKYDIVVFGDVDPRLFTDSQLQLIKDFVDKRGGGFGMIAGPKFSPVAYKNTSIQDLLPVQIGRVEEGVPQSIKEGWRPELTRVGAESSIFRFFEEREHNAKFMKEEIQPLFWYCRGIQVKPGIGEVYAQHPSDTGPDGKRAPILVLGRFGSGRTLFSGIDDSWRWRFYTGENVFDTYWIQQFRYLARAKKLGQHGFMFTANREAYDLGEQVELRLRIQDPQLVTQLPEVIQLEVLDKEGKVANENLVRQESSPDLYVASFTADKIGNFKVRLPEIAGNQQSREIPIVVRVPRLELAQPQVDRTLLTRLASETMGQVVDLDQAPAKLASLIPSAAKQIPVDVSEPLWNKDRALWIFVLLLTAEWVLRKVYGML